jgi:uncharacterized cysteine cluster protein YcgN (CxxCxxCC family)
VRNADHIKGPVANGDCKVWESAITASGTCSITHSESESAGVDGLMAVKAEQLAHSTAQINEYPFNPL